MEGCRKISADIILKVLGFAERHNMILAVYARLNFAAGKVSNTSKSASRYTGKFVMQNVREVSRIRDATEQW